MTNVSSVKVKVVKLVHLGDLPLPKYATNGSAGVDLMAAIEEDLILKPFDRVLIPTGIGIEVPYGYEAQVRSRSGLSYKHGVIVVNSPGTIDSDYRGEVRVIMTNIGKEAYVISRGDKIAQLIINKHEILEWEHVNELNNTERGEGGLGSTGVALKK